MTNGSEPRRRAPLSPATPATTRPARSGTPWSTTARALIVRCASVADVVTAVRTARERDLEIGVRCGGPQHRRPRRAGRRADDRPDRRWAGVRVDPARRRAWVQGGALLGALDRAAQAYGLATTAGNVSHTGVGGLTLGGGMGWLARQYGLACDNVVSLRVVTAAGDVVRASRDRAPRPVLGPARRRRQLRRRHRVRVPAAPRRHPGAGRRSSTFPLDRTPRAVLRGWRDLAEPRPAQATFTADVGRRQRVDRSATSGSATRTPGAPLLPALRALGRPERARSAELTYLELQTRDDTAEGHALRRYWKGHYLRGAARRRDRRALLDRDAGGRHRARRRACRRYGGAIADVADATTPPSATAGRVFEYVAGARWTDPAEDGARMAAARAAGRRAGAVRQRRLRQRAQRRGRGGRPPRLPGRPSSPG